MNEKNNRRAFDAPYRLDIDQLVTELRGARDLWRRKHRGEVANRDFPSREAIKKIVNDLRSALFPVRLGPGGLHKHGEDAYVKFTLEEALAALHVQAGLELNYLAGGARRGELHEESDAAGIVRRFAALLPGIRSMLDSDVEAAFSGDPAARSVDEVLICYPGIIAIIYYRLAHELHNLGLPLVARIISEIAHSDTGIDIHPGARIGPSFFIDHGTGVVIGETAVIGRRVRIYQAVTLGAKGFPRDSAGRLQKGLPRHPVIEDDVVIYAGATILGRVTIGQGAKIGGNVWLTESVPAGHTVNQALARQEVEKKPYKPKAVAGPERGSAPAAKAAISTG